MEGFKDMLEEVTSEEMPHEMEICINSEQLPAIKNWKPGKEHKIPVRIRSIETDEKGRVKGEFVVKGGESEAPKEEKPDDYEEKL